MNITTFLRFTIVMLLLFSCITSANGDDLTILSEAAENRAVAATVRIYAKDHSWEDYEFHGSGFFVTPHLIATNYHVIENKDKSRAKPILAYRHSNKGRFHSVNAVKAFDVKKDLAVLEVSRSRVKPLILGGSETIKRRDRVYVVGFAMGLDSGTTSGIINNPKQPWEGVEYIRIDAAVSPGNSGGPVLNIYGDVIGIATRGSWIIAQNLNFAVPSNKLRSLLYRRRVPLPPKPNRKTVNRETESKKEEKAHAEVKLAEAEARKIEAEAKKVEAEARKAEAEAERAKAEAKIAEAEKPKTNAESPIEEKAKVSDPKTGTINQLQAATVHIYGRDRNGKEGRLGTGFFVREDQVATDFHVVHGSALKGVMQVSQAAQSANALFAARVIKTKKAHHLAILHVEPLDAQPLPIANSDRIQEADEIRVFSNTSQSKGEFSERNISKISPISGILYFEFDAPVAPGSGGGPIVNNRGEVVAVTTLRVPEISGSLNYAVPSNYLTDLLDGEGDNIQNVFPLPPSPPTEQTDSSKLMFPPEPSPYGEWLEKGKKHYEQAKYGDAIRLLESALDELTHPHNRAVANLYLGCARRGCGESQEAVVTAFKEALYYDPNVELPRELGKNHPVFGPLLEKTRKETTGILTVNASPPETKIWIYGGHSKQDEPYVGTVNLRLFKGDYTVVCFLEETRDVKSVKTVHVEPGVRHILDRELTRMPSTSRELTLELDRAVKPQRVEVHYEIYGPTGIELDQGVKLMQLQGEKPNSGTWVYHVKWPPSTPAGKLAYRIKVDGEDIHPIPPPEIVILEPPTNAWVYINQAIDLKARVTSDIQLTEVLVHYSEASKKLRKMDTPDTYIGTVPGRDNRKAGTIWYFVTAKNQEGKMSRSEVRLVEIRRPDDDTDTDSVPPPEIIVLEPSDAAVFSINKPIEIKARVKSSTPIQEVRVYYDFPRKQLSETSPATMLKIKSSHTYVGKIPKERTREEGYIWYFVMATAENGMKSEPTDRVVEIKEPTTQKHQGLWASHSWSNLVSDEGFYSGWERGNVMSLAFLQEGRGFQTLGAQLDYTYENPDYISAMAQWGPSTRENPVSFAFLAGAAGHRPSDPSFSRVRQSRQFTPLLGGSVKFYPIGRVAVDATASVRLQSENASANRDANFIEEYLHHYEAGIRLYISPTLNLKAGYGRWRLGEYDNASVQVGLGATF